MKVKYILLFVILGLIISGVFYFTEFRQEKAEVIGFSVKLVNSEYTMKNNSIKIPFGDKVDIDSEDFKVTEIFSDGKTNVLSKKTDDKFGFDFSSTIPEDDITPAGEYILIFKHSKLNESIEIKIVVQKASVDMSDVTWGYSSPFTYDGTEKEVKLINIPVGVSVSYVGNKATNAGTYSATAIFTYVDANNYEQISNKTLTWEILPTVYNVQGTAKLKDKYKNLIYNGVNQTIELDLSEFDANYVQATIDINTITNKNVGKYFARVDLQYSGTDGNYSGIDKTFVTVEWEIKKASLVITAKSHSITYGDEPSNNGVNYSGFEGSDSSDVLCGSLAFDYTYTKGDIVGTYSLTPKGLSAQNYEITFISGNLNVEKAKIDFKDVDWVKNSSYTYSGVEIKPVLNYQSNEIVVIDYSYFKVGGGNNNPINAGSYVANAEIIILNNNYEIINNNIVDYEYIILPKTISVSNFKWAELDYFYTGNPIKPTIANSVENVLVEEYVYTKNEVVIEPVDVGTYLVKAMLSAVNNNYKLDVDYVDLVYNILPKSIDCSSVGWVGSEEYVLGVEFEKPILTNIPNGILVEYKYLKNGIVVNEIIEAGEYVALVTIVPINGNYVIEKYPTKMQFNFIVKEAEQTEPDSIIELVVDGVEYKIYNDGTLENLEQGFDSDVYTGLISENYLLDERNVLIVESLYILNGTTFEDVLGGHEIDLHDGCIENVELTLTFDNEEDCYASIFSMDLGITIILYFKK